MSSINVHLTNTYFGFGADARFFSIFTIIFFLVNAFKESSPSRPTPSSAISYSFQDKLINTSQFIRGGFFLQKVQSSFSSLLTKQYTIPFCQENQVTDQHSPGVIAKQPDVCYYEGSSSYQDTIILLLQRFRKISQFAQIYLPSILQLLF